MDIDATKAPRTHAAWKKAYDVVELAKFMVELSQQLECELNVDSKERDDALMMLGMYRMKSDEQKQRIKRLEDVLSWYESKVSDCNRQGPEGDTARNALANDYGRKAKEAKLSENPIQSLGENLMKAGIGFTTEAKP